MKKHLREKTLFIYNNKKIIKVEDDRFGCWYYALLVNGFCVEKSYDFNKLKSKIYE